MFKTHRIQLTVNGQRHEAEVEPRLLLVHLLRDILGLQGPRVGCDTSNCGACTVLLNGRSVKSCTLLAVQARGREILTVEGLLRDGELHPIQQAFWEHHALQCGFCTSGMVMSAYYLLSRNPNPTDAQIRQAIAGNLCRCTGYLSIIAAVRAAAERMKSAAS